MSRVQGVRYWKAEELEYKTMRQGLLSLLSTFDRLQVQWAQSSSFAIRLVVSKTNIFWKNWSYNKWNLRKWKSESVFTLKWQHLSIFFHFQLNLTKARYSIWLGVTPSLNQSLTFLEWLKELPNAHVCIGAQLTSGTFLQRLLISK